MAGTRKQAGPLVGAHMSIAGGIPEALVRGRDLGCRTIQIFTRNATRWKSPPLPEEEITAFRQLQKETGIHPVVVHDSYLINIASPDLSKRRASRNALLDEMERTEALGLPFLVMHPGSHMGAGEAAGIRQVIRSLNALHKKTRGFGMKILLETTAGQGTNLGYTFEHLQEMIAGVSDPDRLGVCVDTCHIFAAGYDLRTPAGYKAVLGKAIRLFGRNKILCFHVNDSQKGLGSRVDRHAHIGRGAMGLPAFASLMRDSRFARVPKILETPKGENDEMDRKNLDRLLQLARPSVT